VLAGDAEGVLVDNVLVRLSVALPVVDVPAEGLEERVDELSAHLGLVVRPGAIVASVALEAIYELMYNIRGRVGTETGLVRRHCIVGG